MPYFVFKIWPDEDRRLEHIDTYDVFKEAMNRCRSMRKEMPADAAFQVRMIFAKEIEEARRLLRTSRKPSPVEEWEV